mgnify:CR=1 FL=1
MIVALPLGIVAAVLGIIKTMGAISQPPEYLGKLIGSALVGTFLGVFLAYGFVGPFGSATHTVALPPGGNLILTAPASGWTVTAGTGDLLRVANSGAGTSVTFDIIIIGTSA